MEVAEWLQHTTAGSIMTTAVVTLRLDDLLADAVGQLLDESISGAPVVDEDRVCVGVFSLADVARAEDDAADEQAELVQDSDFFRSHLALPPSIHAERFEAIRDRLVPVGERSVARCMTTDVVSVTEDAPLQSVLEAMVDAHLHRVVVTGSEGHLLGLVSSTDVLAALMRVGLRAEFADETFA